MIYLYSGTPGSGKSLHIASNLYYWLRAGYPCICNFEVNLSALNCKPGKCGEFYYIDNDILRPELLIEYSKLYFKDHKFKEGVITLVVDEAQLLFNAREWNVKGRREWLSFFSQHRKYGYDIILVAQFDRMIDRQIRSLIEYECIHRRVKNYGKFGFIFNLFAGGALFVSVKVWYPMKEVISHNFIKGKKQYYNMYNTYNTFSS